MAEILDPKNTNPANTNKDGKVSDAEQKVYAAAQKAKSVAGSGGGKSGGKSAEDYPVLFQKGVNAPDMVGGGTQDVRKTKTEAISAYATGQLNARQKKILDSAYAKYKASGGRAATEVRELITVVFGPHLAVLLGRFGRHQFEPLRADHPRLGCRLRAGAGPDRDQLDGLVRSHGRHSRL